MAAEGMEVEPDDLLVTTGGQQVIDLVCKTLIDPGDVIIAEAPDLPRRRARRSLLPGRRRADRDGRATACGSTCSRRRSRASTREGRAPEVHLHDPDLPEPGAA